MFRLKQIKARERKKKGRKGREKEGGKEGRKGSKKEERKEGWFFEVFRK